MFPILVTLKLFIANLNLTHLSTHVFTIPFRLLLASSVYTAPITSLITLERIARPSQWFLLWVSDPHGVSTITPVRRLDGLLLFLLNAKNLYLQRDAIMHNGLLPRHSFQTPVVLCIALVFLSSSFLVVLYIYDSDSMGRFTRVSSLVRKCKILVRRRSRASIQLICIRL